MAKRRKPKRHSVDVSGHVPVPAQPPGWEADLMVEAFARLKSSRPTGGNEAPRATMTKLENTDVAA
jgi:hypothetical protein